MDDLFRRAIDHICQTFGHPRGADLTDDRLDEFDVRLTETEQRQRKIAARLRLLEQQADPRGRFARG